MNHINKLSKKSQQLQAFRNSQTRKFALQIKLNGKSSGGFCKKPQQQVAGVSKGISYFIYNKKILEN